MIHLAYNPAPSIEVDRESGVIRNVAVITAGIVAHGHNAPPFATDSVLLQQVAASINAQANGVKCRMGHAEVAEVDGLHVLVGKIKNARVDGDVVRADFYAGKGADKDDLDRLFWLAEDAPEDAGLSIVPADYEFIEENGELHLRVQSMFAVDWVGVPAANLAGMLSKTNLGVTPRKATAMSFNESQIAFLKGLGLAEGASEEDMQKMADGLDEEKKAEFAALMTPEPVEEPAVEEEPAAAAVAAPVAASKSTPKPLALAKPDHKASLSEINEIASLAGLPGEWVVQMSLEGKTPAEARKLALAAKVKQSGAGNVPTITVGENGNRFSLRQAIPDAIMLRSGYAPKNPHARAAELQGLSLLDMARHHYAAIGVRDAFMLSRVELCNMIAPRYFRNKYPALQSSSEFDNILADTVNKTLRQAYGEAPATWNLWARKETAPDFKTVRRTQLNSLPTLTERTEGQPLIYVAVNDSGETYTLVEYHEGVKLTRRAMINDDLNAFSRITKQMGEAAKRLEDDVAYSVFATVGPTMADGGALFNETAVTTAGGHANFTDTGTAITTTSLGVGFTKMYKQTGGALGVGSALELRPKFLICAAEIEYIARQTISSTELLSTEALTSGGVMKGTSNPFHNTVQVIPTTRLGSTTAWILAADPNRIDTVEVCFLQGEESPVLAQESDFDTDDMKFKVRHTVKAAPIDWRGLYRNDGA